MNNNINQIYFQDEINFENFRLLLDSLNHVKPIYISREEYQNLSWEILQIKWKDKVGDFYDLYLPTDLKKAELLSLTILLTQKFKLKEYAHLENLISKVKLLVELITRELPDDEKESFLQEMLLAGNVDDNLYYRIISQKMLFSPAKEILKSFEWEKLSQEQLIQELLNILESEFHLTFFRKWVNMLRLGMMTMTAGEIPNIRKKKWQIEINIPAAQLDKNERLLREKIAIEKLKKELDAARKTNNQKVIQSVELKVVNKIMYVLYEYPYQVTDDHFWFEPSKIIEHKEIYCTGMCILAHAFLTELWIEHYWLTIFEHSALEVVIWKKRYYFDVTTGDSVIWMKNITQVWQMEKVSLKELEFPEIYFQRFSPEETLLSHIASNIWNRLFNLEKYKQALVMFQHALDLNPGDPNTYRYLANTLRELDHHKESEPFFQKSLDIHPLEYDSYNNYGVLLNVLKRYQEALNHFNTAISINNKDLSWYLNKARSLFYLQQYSEALICLDKVIIIF